MLDTSPDRRWRTQFTTLFAILFFTGLGLLFLRGIFRDFDHLGAKDWNAFMGQTEAEVASIERDGEFPLWNPWRRGGQVSFAQPESMFLSPVLPLALAFGTITAFKLVLIPTYVIGCLGLYALAGLLGLKGPARFAPPLMFFTSAAFPFYLAGGLPNWLFGLAILPWLLYFRRRAVDGHHFVLFGALAYAGVLFCGSVYQFVFYPLFVGIDALLESIVTRNRRPVLTAVAMLGVGASIALVRILPMYDVYRVYPRELAAEERYLTFEFIWRAFLDHRHPDLFPLEGTVLREGDNWVSWVTVGCYIGPVFAFLTILGFIVRRKETVGILWLAVFMIWLGFGSGAIVSLWDLVHRFPLLRSMQAPERMLVPTTLVLSLAAGFAVSWVMSRLEQRGTSSKNVVRAGALLVFVACVPPLLANRGIAFAAFPEAPLRSPPQQGEFRQVQQPKRPTQWGGELYDAVRANRGNPFAQADVPSPHAVHAYGEEGYAGEAWLAHGFGSVEAEIRINEIRVHAELTADDALLVNQNYFPGWRVSGTVNGPALPRQGVLSVALPKGSHDLVLRFEQPSVRVGAILSLAAVALGLVVLLRRRSSGAHPAVVGLTEKFGLGGCALLLLAVPLNNRFGAAPALPESVRVSQRGALVVDAALADAGSYVDIQRAIDAAVSGDLIVVKPGEYPPFQIRSGVTVMAEKNGTALVKGGGFEIHDVPTGYPAQVVGLVVGDPTASVTVKNCSGNVVLQEVRIGGPLTPDSVALHIEKCFAVHLLRSETGVVHVRGGLFIASHCKIEAPHGATSLAALDVLNGVALLLENEIRGYRASAVIARKSRIDVVSRKSGALACEGDGPISRLGSGSRLRFSGFELDESRVETGGNSTYSRFAPPLPSASFVEVPTAGKEIEIEVRGPANGRGTVIMSPVASLIESPRSKLWVQSNWSSGNMLIPVELPASGVLRIQTAVKGIQLNVGWPIFLQFMLETGVSGEGPNVIRGFRASLLDGSIVRP